MLSDADIRALEHAARRALDNDVFCSLCGISAPAHGDDCIISQLRGEYQENVSRLVADTGGSQKGESH